MPRISGSGFERKFDFESLVQNLVAVERRPLAAVRQKQTELTAQLSSFSTLRAQLASLKFALDPLRSLSAFEGKSALSSDSDRLRATATSAAIPGISTLQITELAKAHKLQSPSFSSDTAVVGTGTLKITVGKAETTVLIDESHQTLSGIMDKINSANAGVTASIHKLKEAEFRLTLQANETGAENRVHVDVSDGLSQVNNLTELQAPSDALFKIDDVSFSRSTNTVTEAIPGVTLTLLRETEPGADIAVTVLPSAASARGKIEPFVSAFNSVITTLRTAQAFDPKTQQKGPLLGDTAARIILRRLQSLVGERVLGLRGLKDSLVSLGLSTAKDGTLKIDAAKLDAAIEKDPLAVGRVFASADETVNTTVTAPSSGVAHRLFAEVSELLSPTQGDIVAREKGLKGTMATLEAQANRIEKHATEFEQKTRERFSRLEAALEQIEGTGLILNAQISQLSNIRSFLRGGSSGSR